jgi:hypothetical protein
LLQINLQRKITNYFNKKTYPVSLLQQELCVCSNNKMNNNSVLIKMIDNKNHQLFQQNAQTNTTKIITYLQERHQKI